MALQYTIDAEDAGSKPWEFDAVDESGGAMSLDSGTKYEGTYSYKFLTDGVAIALHGDKTLTDLTELWTSHWIYITDGEWATIANTLVGILQIWDGASWRARLNFRNDATLHPYAWSIQVSGQTALVNTLNFAVDTWLNIETHFKAGSGSDGGFEAWCNGGYLGGYMTLNWSANALDKIVAGIEYSMETPPTGQSYFIDYFRGDNANRLEAWPTAGAGGEGLTRGGLIEPTWFDLIKYGKKRR
jgi:hypothetical protein